MTNSRSLTAEDGLRASIQRDVEIGLEDDTESGSGEYAETDSETIIRISDVLEYLFCSRFIYYMYCLDIPQHEEKRFKVLK
ncbi:MAG: hypothetical protein PHE01_10315, partial [Methanosarcina sp.]|nr:hypothetical protein [Methanosarcina sp.]